VREAACREIREETGVEIALLGLVDVTLGTEIEIPTLEGPVNLKIPAGTQASHVFKMGRRGIKSIRGQARGDLLCHVVLETPVNLNSRQKNLLEQFRDSLSSNGRKQSPQKAKWFDMVKNFFDKLDS